MSTSIPTPSLEQQRQSFASRRLINTPLAGLICWALVGIANYFVEPYLGAIILFIATGSIVYVAMLMPFITGEPFFHREKNVFDKLFFYGVFMSLLVYCIAIPFYLIEPSSLPLTVGILTGLMWVPISWILNHWIGLAHTLVRTIAILACWYIFPEQRFVLIPAVIVVIYIPSIMILNQRWRAHHKESGQELTNPA